VSSSQVSTLFDTVVEGGYCVGCGACAAVQDSPITMRLDSYGRYVAHLAAEPDAHDSSARVLEVCPFSPDGPNEDALGASLFGAAGQHDDRIGYHLGTYAGYVAEDGFRSRGSSGGMGSWLLTEFLRVGLVDRVAHVREHPPSDDDPALFRFELASTPQEVAAGGKSRYYPVELSGVLEAIRSIPGKYAVVGVPCFIKAVRRLAQQDPVLQQRIRFAVAIFCGHLKSSRFAESLAWQCGIPPDSIVSIDFRRKLPGRPANRYGVEITGRSDGHELHAVRPVQGLYGGNWGHGLFMYEACDYCDDVVGETADVSVGDAWLPGYVEDSAGTNVVVVRNPEVQALIEKGISSKRLALQPLDADGVAESQSAAFRHRRDGLAYRLHLKDQAQRWRPHKRVPPAVKHLTRKQRAIFRLRMQIAAHSHTAFQRALDAKRFDVFQVEIEPLLVAYARRGAPLGRFIWGRPRRMLRALVRGPARAARGVISRRRAV